MIFRIAIAVIVLELAVCSLIAASVRKPIKPAPVVQYCASGVAFPIFIPCDELDRYEEA